MSNVIPEGLLAQLQMAMGNLKFASLLCEFLEKEHGNPVPPIPCEVVLHGHSGGAIVSDQNCGFITTPVIHTAALDIRRILEFLGLQYKFGEAQFDSLPPRVGSRLDDIRIEDCGVKKISPADLESLSQALFQKSTKEFLPEILTYANKQLAHITSTDTIPKFGNIRDASHLMIEAVMKFLFDERGDQRPGIHPSVD